MKGFLSDSIFNPFDTIFPNNPGLADMALINWVQKQTTRIEEQKTIDDDEYEED